MAETENSGSIYFTVREIGILVLLSVLAALTGALVPSYLFPEDRVSAIVYGALGLPGPGAGVLIFGSILCFWLVLGLLVIKKTGSAVVMSVLIIAIDLLFGQQSVTLNTLDVFVFVALILEIVSLLPKKKMVLDRALPVVLSGLGAYTLFLVITGRAKTGETDVAVTGFPAGYVIIGILALLFGIVCYRYPVRYFFGGAVANMYYALHFWLFWGISFGDRLPVSPEVIPVIFCIAGTGGGFLAAAAYGIDLTLQMYRKEASVATDQ